MRKVTFYLRKSDNPAAVMPLYADLYINRKKIRIPTGVAGTASSWDPRREAFTGRSADVSDKNLIIANVRARITEILVRERLSGKPLDKDEFMRLYRLPEGESEEMKFADYARQRLRRHSDMWQPLTIDHHLTVIKKVEDYAPGLRLSEITTDWLRTYAGHLRRAHNNSPSTIGKNMSIIRTHYNAALKEGRVTPACNPFDAYRVPSGVSRVIYLTREELERLITLYNSAQLCDNEQDVLRFFLFMAMTGMHISDARSLQLNQIFNGEIHYKRIKTGTTVNMPVSASTRKLLDFYRAGRSRGPLFLNLPTDQAFNRLIKRVCARVNITKPISAKAARHTFATLYYQLNDGDLATLARLLGHTKINTTMIYTHTARESREQGLAAFDDFL